jgi:hypothetical protein
VRGGGRGGGGGGDGNGEQVMVVVVAVAVAEVVMLKAVVPVREGAAGSAWVHKGVECWPGQPQESI